MNYLVVAEHVSVGVNQVPLQVRISQVKYLPQRGPKNLNVLVAAKVKQKMRRSGPSIRILPRK